MSEAMGDAAGGYARPPGMRRRPMARKHRRLVVVLLGLLALGGATALVLSAFSDNLVFFFAPSELAEKGVRPGQRVRIGGLVEPGSVKRDGAVLSFVMTDGKGSVPVVYRGAVPDLFREGQGVVTTGTLDAGGRFEASQLLAKHDERYMPPEVVEALKRAGRWGEGGPGHVMPASGGGGR